MNERRPYWAWAVSGALHGALLLFLILGFASAPKFEDNPEAIPVDVVSAAQLNQIMNGEKTAKPSPLPPRAPKAEPAPPAPPEPPPDLRKAEEAAAAPEPPPKPEPEPPKPEPAPPPKPEPAPPPRPEPAPKQAEAPKPPDAPTPPERPKAPAPERPPEKPKPDAIAKVVEHDKTEPKPEPKPTHAFDPNAIAKLIAKPAPAAAAGQPGAPAPTPQGLPHRDAPKMSMSMASALDAWLTESYLACWTPPPGMPEGDVYVAAIKVVFKPDGSLSARPVLLNPPTDPAWRAHAESAMRAVRKCDPLHVPAEYAPYFEQWKIETIHFDPRDTQG